MNSKPWRHRGDELQSNYMDLDGGDLRLTDRVPLQGDRFTAELEAPAIRRVSIDGHEFAQTITFTVRDRNWRSIGSADWSTSVDASFDSFRVNSTGRFTSDEVDLYATIMIRTRGDGSLTYSVEATALRDFERARIGICVMHPLTLSGKPLHVTTPSGAYSTTFPVDISASRGVTNIESLRHPLGDGRDVRIQFEGDLFEFEDQRNWADASYKTFCTPLSAPWPIVVHAGDVIEQQLRVSTIGDRSPTERKATKTTRRTSVNIDLDAEGPKIPSIGVLSDTDAPAIRAARTVGVSHVRISVDAASETAIRELSNVGDVLAGSDVAIELEVVASKPSELAALHATIANLGGRLHRIFVFDRATQITNLAYGPAIDQLRSHSSATIGGGSASNFAGINFNVDDIAFDALRVLTFPLSPQVHYTDDFSFITNLDAQRVVAANGRRLAGGRALSIGPITFMPRRAGEPPMYDPRSESLLGAAWTVASLGELIGIGAEALTYQVRNRADMDDRNETATPAHHVLTSLLGCKAASYLPMHIDSQPYRVAGFALRCRSHVLMMVANLEPAPVAVDIVLDPRGISMRTLDETTCDTSRDHRAEFFSTAVPWHGETLHMLPFAVVCMSISS